MANAISSGAIATGTTNVYNGKGSMNGLLVISDGVNTATAIVYDNTAGSGTVLARASATTTQGAVNIQFNTPVRCDIGLTVVVSGAGAPLAVVYFGG